MSIKGLITFQNQTVINFFKKLSIELTTDETSPKLVVCPGGGDVNSSLYYEKEAIQTMATTRYRDYEESCKILGARLWGIPTVGICRGHQLMNVLDGGTLIQHIEGHRGGTHDLCDGEGNPLENGFKVNSTHHQAIPCYDRYGYDECLFSKYGKDDQLIIEAIFDEDKKIFSTQFHPEYATASDASIDYFANKIDALLKG